MVQQFVTKTPTPVAPATPGQAEGVPQAQVVSNPWSLPPQKAAPAWDFNQPLSMHVHLSTSATGDVFSAQWTSAWRKDADEGLPNFKWENITYGDWQETRVKDLNVTLPEVRYLAGRIVANAQNDTACHAERLPMGRYVPRERWCKPQSCTRQLRSSFCPSHP